MDVAKAMDILGGHLCVLGRGPFSLKLASPNEVAEYYKELFKKQARKGGLLMNIRLPDEGGVEDIRAMLDDIREHTRY